MASVSPRRTKADALSTSQFGEKIKELTDAFKTIIVLEDLISKAGKEGIKTVDYMNLKGVDKKEVTRMKNTYLKGLKDLKKVYSEGYNRRRTTGGKGGPNSGLRKPIVMNDILLGFFDKANLGNIRALIPATLTTPAGINEFPQTLRSQLSFLAPEGELLRGVANRGLLTSLMSLYAKVNKLSSLSEYNQARAGTEFVNNQLLGADALMNQFFAQTFVDITRESQAKLQTGNKGGAMLNAAGQPARDGDKKPIKTSKRERHYFRDFTMVPGADGKKQKQFGNAHPIWNDFYHVFNSRNFSYGNLQSIVSKNVAKEKAGLESLLERVPDVMAAAYQDGINAAVAAGQPLNYNLIAEAALATYNTEALKRGDNAAVLANVPNSLVVRVNLDQVYSLVSSSLATYSTGKSKKSKK